MKHNDTGIIVRYGFGYKSITDANHTFEYCESYYNYSYYGNKIIALQVIEI
jgi:hypothetical protein